jgi:hypothetical protein
MTRAGCRGQTDPDGMNKDLYDKWNPINHPINNPINNPITSAKRQKLNEAEAVARIAKMCPDEAKAKVM